MNPETSLRRTAAVSIAVLIVAFFTLTVPGHVLDAAAWHIASTVADVVSAYIVQVWNAILWVFGWVI